MTSLQGQWLSPEHAQVLSQENTSAHRIFSGADVYVERYGNHILICHSKAIEPAALVKEIGAWGNQAGLEFQRFFLKSLVKNPNSDNKPVQIEGPAGSEDVVTELEVKYHVDLTAGYSTGLFIDQRENRRFLKNLRPAKLLNCFAYTCSFSVVAALQGTETTSVDLARKALVVGEKNFELNQLSLASHHFIADDVRPAFKWLARKGVLFDTIILDPPTFSRSKGHKPFQVERDFFDLLDHALKCAASNASILLSTNCQSFHVQNLMTGARELLEKHHLHGIFHTTPQPIDIPANAMPSTAWLRLT